MTPSPRAIALLLGCLILLGWNERSAAQSESPAEMMMRDKPPTMPAPPEPAAGVEELSLETYYLYDENGQLVPVLKGLKYEEWEQIYKAKLELANPEVPPRYALQSLRLSGAVVDNAIDLTLEVEIQVMASGWIRVPLRMARAALRQPLECEAGQQCFLEYDQEGYVLWLHEPAPEKPNPPEESPPADEASPTASAAETDSEADDAEPAAATVPVRTRKYRLDLTVPVSAKAGEHELLLQLPRKAVTSEFSLLIDEQAKLTLPPMTRSTREAAGEGLARVTLAGVGGEFRLRWTDPAMTLAASELDVYSLTLTELSGPRSIKSTARLRVRSLNGPLRQFSVLLPPGMSLLPQPASEAFDLVAEQSETMPSSKDRQRVTIELATPTTEDFELTLSASAVRSQAELYTQFEITGFEVAEAKLQSGHLALSVEGDWYLHWTAENNSLRQVDVLQEPLEVELAAWKAANIIARFHCTSFPANLRVRVTPQRSLVQVEPTYQVYVSDNQLRLEATLNYRVRGRKLELLEVELADWKLPTIAPESLVRLEAVVNENGALAIPLQQPTGGDFTLKLQATQQLDPAVGNFDFTLPRVRTSQPEREQLTAAPAMLAMICDDDVAVSPMIDQIEGLSPEAASGIENLPEREQPPRIYRQRNDNRTASKFVGHVQIVPQTVSVASSTEIRPEKDQFQVTTRLQYTVKHEPLEWLMLELPSRLITPESIDAEILIDGQPIVPTMQPPQDGSPPTALLILNEARQGTFKLQIQYRWKIPDAEQTPAVRPVIELVRPASNRSYSSTSSLLMLAQHNLLRMEDSSAWKRVAGSELQGTTDAAWQFQADTLVATVPLRPLTAENESLRRTAVKLAWYQTWLTSSSRRNRAVFLLESTQKNVALQLPQVGELKQMEVVVDQRVVDTLKVLSEQRTVVIELPESSSGEYVIQLMYEESARHWTPIWQGGMSRFRFPQLVGGDPERVYWQLVLPSNEYLWLEPEGVTSESPWTMPTLLAPARPALTQQELEHWSGAVPTPPPAAGANVYLFSGFGQIEQLTTGIVNRRAVVLLGAGLVLALALPLIYLPSLRGWKTLLGAGAALLLLGLSFPYPAQLLGSSVVAGCLLVLLARFLQITLSRRRHAPRLLPGRESMQNQATLHAFTLEADGNSQGSSHDTTATAPAVYAAAIGKQEAPS